MTSRRAEYRVPCDSPDQAERIRRALAVETHDAPARTRIVVSTAQSTLVVEITSDDTRGLRAATHSFLRWAQTALDVDRLVSRPESFKPNPPSST